MNAPEPDREMPLEHRLRRIGELLVSAIIRGSALLAPAADSNTTAPRLEGPEDLAIDEAERSIIAYLNRWGSASPRDLELGLGLTRLVVQRRLARLRGLAVVWRTGQRRSVRYSLRTDFRAN